MLKVIRYIDCDGVILDTELNLFDEYNRLKEAGTDIKRLAYLQQLDWREWVRQAPIINNSIEILKNNSEDAVEILTKVHSLAEGSAKIEYFRELGIKNNIILVPHNLNKSDVVEAQGHLLVDDSIKNLDNWSFYNGIPLFFNQFGTNQSIFKEQVEINDQYPIISSLDSVFSKETEEYCKQLLLKK